MAKFDILRFFKQHNIAYTDTGPNVSGANVVIHCPFCRDADQSMHLSVSTEGRGYRCWRNKEHRGIKPTRLVQALLGCTWERAFSITGGVAIDADADWHSKVHKLLKPDISQLQAPEVILPPEFHAFIAENIISLVYVRYLKNRGIDWRGLTKRYGVYFANLGKWKGRIIFTISFEGRLVGWTGRTVFPAHEPRYLALTTDTERAKRMGVTPAAGPLPNYLLWYDHLCKTPAHTLCICEGPFDALKVRMLGREKGITATCLFTSSPSKQQLELLHEVLPRFKRKVSLLDAGTLPAALRLSRDLAMLDVDVVTLPDWLKDPGELGTVQELVGVLKC